ncbi:hypothetical protein E2C01_066036 [Portunus trituberculatus]|uniref:Uncharacterized protein n=1 Tax=Portunus trituberculatus TaxID=210409 RepID=A0A5B7HH64_PORTR|nr:hypothetical protein [Portunus trituberculatus]
MWAFHGSLWAKGDTFWGTSYLKAHPLGGCPTYTWTMDRIKTRARGDPSDPKARMVLLYHCGSFTSVIRKPSFACGSNAKC